MKLLSAILLLAMVENGWAMSPKVYDDKDASVDVDIPTNTWAYERHIL